MLEGLHPSPSGLSSTAPTIPPATAAAVLAAVASQPQLQQVAAAAVAAAAGRPPFPPRPAGPVQMGLPPQLQSLQQQPAAAGTLPAAAAAASSISAGSRSLEALLCVGCSKREAEVAWDLLTLWRLMRLGCDPGYGHYYLPLHRYTRQPALIIRLQACKSEKQLAKYIVRLVHAYRKKSRSGGGGGAPHPLFSGPGAGAPPAKRLGVEEGVQIMNQLLRLLAEGEGGDRPAAAAAREVQQLAEQVQHLEQQQHQQQMFFPPGPVLFPPPPPLLGLLPQEAAAPGPLLGGARGELWGHDVVMGMPHAVLLDPPLMQHQHAAGALGARGMDLGEAESAIMGLPRAGSVGDFLS